MVWMPVSQLVGFQVPWQRFILLVFAFPSDFFVRRDLTEWPDKK